MLTALHKITQIRDGWRNGLFLQIKVYVKTSWQLLVFFLCSAIAIHGGSQTLSQFSTFLHMKMVLKMSILKIV